MMKVHLVIPCYNEDASLKKLYQEQLILEMKTNLNFTY